MSGEAPLLAHVGNLDQVTGGCGAAGGVGDILDHMTDTQLYFAVGLPCLTVIASLVVSLLGISGVRETSKEIREDIREIRTDIKIIVQKLGAMDLEIGKLMDRKS